MIAARGVAEYFSGVVVSHGAFGIVLLRISLVVPDEYLTAVYRGLRAILSWVYGQSLEFLI